MTSLLANNTIVIPLFVLSFFIMDKSCLEAQELSLEDSCLLEIFKNGPDEMTLGEAKKNCVQQLATASATTVLAPTDKTAEGIIENRLEVDESNTLKPFTLMSHYQNYILPAAHNFQGWSSDDWEAASGRDEISFENTEIQFQLSIKTPLATRLFDRDISLFTAYTVRSFWQAYNKEISSPFRETNHTPETWLQFRPDWSILGFKNNSNVFGVVHQSNGQSGPLSRSWNRVYAGFVFERGNFAMLIKPWYRIQEDADKDDNRDITDFLGHGELSFAYKLSDHVFTVMSRNNLESGFSRGAIQFGWSFPLFEYDYLKGYVQYFSGYGESLIDYNRYVNRIGVGIILTDIL